MRVCKEMTDLSFHQNYSFKSLTLVIQRYYTKAFIKNVTIRELKSNFTVCEYHATLSGITEEFENCPVAQHILSILEILLFFAKSNKQSPAQMNMNTLQF